MSDRTTQNNGAVRELFRAYIAETRKHVPPEERIILLSMIHGGWGCIGGDERVDFIVENCPDDALGFSKMHGVPIRDWYKILRQVWEQAGTLDEYVFTSAVEENGLKEFTREAIGAMWYDATEHGFEYDWSIIRGAVDILNRRRNESIVAMAAGEIQ